jgi:hypothetical protein
VADPALIVPPAAKMSRSIISPRYFWGKCVQIRPFLNRQSCTVVLVCGAELVFGLIIRGAGWLCLAVDYLVGRPARLERDLNMNFQELGVSALRVGQRRRAVLNFVVEANRRRVGVRIRDGQSLS